MKKTPILSDEQILNLWDTHVGEPCSTMPLVDSDKEAFARAIEQAVLQSPQAQQWRKDAERYQYAKSGESSGKVDICITRKNWHESDHVILCEDRADREIDAAMETKT